VEVNPFTERIYTAAEFQSPNVVDIIDGDTRQIINRLPIPSTPTDSAIDLVHHRLYITSTDFGVDPEGNVVTVIDTKP
jgi:DNA-binding beta-propeller fold protein YncE